MRYQLPMRLTSAFGSALGALVVLASCGQDVADPSGGLLVTATETDGGDGSGTVPASTGEPTSDSETDGTGDSTGVGGTTGEPPAEESSSEDGNGGSICNNGVIEGNEECDCGGAPCTVDGLGGLSCFDVAGRNPRAPGPPTGGPLLCNPASCKLDIAECTYCGDRSLNGQETCEIDMPIDTTCSALGVGAVGALTCGADCQIDTRACTDCGYEDDFDDCGGGVKGVDWFATVVTNGGAATSSWACGDPSGIGPAGANGVWGTNLSGPYQPYEASGLVSSPLDFTNCDEPIIELRLTHWFDFDHSGPVADDGGIVQVGPSPDGPWTKLVPTGGVPYSGGTIGAALPPVANQQGFAFESGGWVVSTFDLAPWADAPLYLRFVVGSDDSQELAGWYIDRIEIIGLLE
jgi:hypothetical protein